MGLPAAGWTHDASVRRARRTGRSHGEEELQLRQLDVDLRQVLARSRDVVEDAGGRVLVPLARLIEQRVIVLRVDGPLPVGALNGVVAPGVLVPGGLRHRHGVVLTL